MSDDYQQGLKAFREGQYDKAVDFLIRASEKDDQNPKIWNALGVSLSKTGEYKDAESCFENALVLDPGNITYEKNLNQSKSKSDLPKNVKFTSGSKKNNVSTNPTDYQNPLIPLVLSIFFPGIGQVYNGEGGVAGLIRCIATAIGYCLVFIPGLILHLYFIYNAYNTRKQMNDGEIPVKSGTGKDFIIYFIAIPVFILITVVGAAMIAAFVFGMAGNTHAVDNSPSTNLYTPSTNPTTVPKLTPEPTKTVINDAPITVPYDDLMREPEKYQGKTIQVTGDVIQAIDDQSVIQSKLGTDGQNIMLVTNAEAVVQGAKLENYALLCVDRPLGKRIMQGDKLSLTFISGGLFTYETAQGVATTVPTGIVKSGSFL